MRLGGPLEEREDVPLIFAAANDKEEIERRLADEIPGRSGLTSTTRISALGTADWRPGGRMKQRP